MKKTDLIAIILAVIIIIIGAFYAFSQDRHNDGICDECKGYMEKVGTVFPYAQYRCIDCGYYKLCNN